MRTTITIQENLLEEAKKISGKQKHSEAIVTSLEDYVALKKRLAYLQELFSKKLPHSFSQIKTIRERIRWSAK